MSTSTPSQSQSEQGSAGRSLKLVAIGFLIASLVVIAGIITIALLVTQGGGLAVTVEVIRDLLVIFLVMVMLLGGAALAVLLVQIARLANMLHNEALPILASSTEVVNTIRGTTNFLSQNLVEPLIQVNSVMAGAREAFKIVRDFQHLRDLMVNAAAAGTNDDSKASEAEFE